MTTAHDSPGYPYPLGATWTPSGVNFALYVLDADGVELCLFDETFQQPRIIPLDPTRHRTGRIWHILLQEMEHYAGYSYRVKKGTRTSADLLDPYACSVISRREAPLNLYNPLARLPRPDTFDWENDRLPNHRLSDLIIYEMHLAGFTKDPSSGVKHPGTYLGAIEKIPHLVDLGINAVELMPVFEFDPKQSERCGIASREILGNYWGYSTTNFFSPTSSFAATQNCIDEFRQLVRALHKANIEVILDVVYNHTSDGNAYRSVQSFGELANKTYYMLDGRGQHLNFTGCGNTFNCNQPVVRDLIIESLRYWVAHMHVDGFRFDLASILTRDRHGQPHGHSPLLEAIEEDPALANVKLIAEPWDAAGLYQVGSFRPTGRRWSEWNGRYRDSVRSFIKGTPNSKGDFATRICGSEDLYGDGGSPDNSINFITAHDGFTLADLVSYDHKHNEANGEGGRDGTNDNVSWNCGAEGPTEDLKILSRRKRQMRNFLVALTVSRGVPMLLMGDEYGHTKHGNNNTWCLDDNRNWLIWSKLEQNADWTRFVKGLIALRKTNPILCRNAFYTKYEIEWHGPRPSNPDWSNNNALLAFSLKDNARGTYLYVAFNASGNSCPFTLPTLSYGHSWSWVVNTANAPPDDLYDSPKQIDHSTISLAEYSSVILQG